MNEKKEDNSIIRKNQKYFSFYTIIPRITSIFLAILFFISGIIFSALFNDAIYFLIFWLGGVIITVFIYLITHLLLSYNILQIYYLKKICSLLNNEDDEFDDEETNIDEENIPEDDECPMCFHKIKETDKECPYCGYVLNKK